MAMQNVMLPVSALGVGVRVSQLQPNWPPLFIEPGDNDLGGHGGFVAWLREHRAVMDSLIAHHGAIVLRGFAVTTTEDFEDVIAEFPTYSQGYLGGASPRRALGKKALESTYIAPHYRIPIHQEMAYARDMPPRLMFFGRVIADRGGETIIADMRQLTASLPSALRTKLERVGACSVRNFGPADSDPAKAAIDPDFLPWTTGFATTDRSEAEQACVALGREAIWNANGSLTTIVRLPGFAAHPVTGETVYRVNFHTPGHPFSDDSEEVRELKSFQAKSSGMYWGDGTDLAAEEIQGFADCVDRFTIEWPWQAGDILVLDNLLVGHGRNPFEGKRETQVALLG